MYLPQATKQARKTSHVTTNVIKYMSASWSTLSWSCVFASQNPYTGSPMNECCTHIHIHIMECGKVA